MVIMVIVITISSVSPETLREKGPPMFATDRARKLATLAITSIGFFMVLLDASIVTVALPTIQSSLHARLLDLQWVVDAYTLPFAVLLLAAGTLGDRFGRKRLFLAGLV